MSKGWRFYPCVGYPNDGIVIPPQGRAFIATFLTPEKARERAQAEQQKKAGQ